MSKMRDDEKIGNPENWLKLIEALRKINKNGERYDIKSWNYCPWGAFKKYFPRNVSLDSDTFTAIAKTFGLNESAISENGVSLSPSPTNDSILGYMFSCSGPKNLETAIKRATELYEEFCSNSLDKENKNMTQYSVVFTNQNELYLRNIEKGRWYSASAGNAQAYFTRDSSGCIIRILDGCITAMTSYNEFLPVTEIKNGKLAFNLVYEV